MSPPPPRRAIFRSTTTHRRRGCTIAQPAFMGSSAWMSRRESPLTTPDSNKVGGPRTIHCTPQHRCSGPAGPQGLGSEMARGRPGGAGAEAWRWARPQYGQVAVSALGSGRACPATVIAFCPSCQLVARPLSVRRTGVHPSTPLHWARGGRGRSRYGQRHGPHSHRSPLQKRLSGRGLSKGHPLAHSNGCVQMNATEGPSQTCH